MFLVLNGPAAWRPASHPIKPAKKSKKSFLNFSLHTYFQMLSFCGYGLGMVDGNRIDPAPPKVHVVELSMSRPEEFDQDFDWKYTQDAKELSERPWESFAE